MSDLPPIARALRAWRAREGLSQRAAAKAFGVPLTGWTDMEQRGTAPRTHVANVAGSLILALLAEKSGA